VRYLIKFFIDKKIFFQSFSGFSVRGFFYNILKNYDESLAIKIHRNKGLASFSTTPIFIYNKNLKVVYEKIENASSCLIWFSLLDSELAKIFKDAILSMRLENIVLGSEKYKTIEINVNHISFKDMIKKAKVIKTFSITFITPTYFRITPRQKKLSKNRKLSINSMISPYRFYLFPDPVLMFRNIVRIWRHFSNYPFNYEKYLEWIESGGVAISGFPKGIKTIRVYEHPTLNKWCVGFTGKVFFDLPSDTYKKDMAQLTDALLKFAEFSNVGGNRTAGFGVIKYEAKEENA
jgi:CRISPR-associated endoribonuclease Cas6